MWVHKTISSDWLAGGIICGILAFVVLTITPVLAVTLPAYFGGKLFIIAVALKCEDSACSPTAATYLLFPLAFFIVGALLGGLYSNFKRIFTHKETQQS